jgi:hypothetical protein
MKPYKLWLDDIRMPYDNIPGANISEWVIADSYDHATWYIDNWGFPQEVDLDHDLGGILTGMDVAEYLVGKDIVNHDMPAGFKYRCHSANPDGRQNILTYLDNYMVAKAGAIIGI